MSILLNCTNKKCFKQGYHELNLDTDQVICVECQQPINATPQIKIALKGQKQIVTPEKSASNIACPSCNATEPPCILKQGNRLYVGCEVCKGINKHLSRYFLPIYKEREGVKTFTIPVANPAALQQGPSPSLSKMEGGVIVTAPARELIEMSGVAEEDDSSLITDDNGRPKIKTSKR